MIGVVVPAHNEEDRIGVCLRSLLVASCCPMLSGEAVVIVVVLDSCTDGTGAIAAAMGVVTVAADARNVGVARARGAAAALRAGARWLCFTDADSTVAPDWVSAQLALGCDAVCGTVTVNDWSEHGPATRAAYEAHYTDADGHRHIHGANLGVSSQVYREVGGFRPYACSEDVALVEALRKHGASIAWSAAPRVVTSARRRWRARMSCSACKGPIRRRWRAAGGFGSTLDRFAHAALDDSTRTAASLP